ncbi:ABC transporter ATP-binding protein [Fodinibius halophilus]|uniref:ABC transporter ATP-binding protein n=1 Tax=Fodinibius halophilus TaxID=1736908 RepID=A0A6M1TFU6_9BACT|nr:ABC transporter ATP-binding protein [Fodinibius halophilus]NGP87510.1 ABC transporter ATP-binding protein [Fodinibius halophilus]
MKSIELTNISTYYKKSIFQKTKVLRNIDLKLQKGKIYGLLGPNGAGKTTLIKTLLGLLRKHDGTISYYNEGKKVSRVKWLQRVGFVPEEVTFSQNITGRNFLKLMGNLYPINKKDLTQRVKDLFQLVGLESEKEKSINAYSKGMKKRLLIAQALLCNPHMLFLDEPMAGLDPKQRNQMRSLFTQYKDQGTGILISSHELPEIQMICDAIFLIKDGQIILTENLDSLDSFQSNPEVQLAINDINELPQKISTKYHCSEEHGRITISVKQDNLQELLAVLNDNGIAVKNIQTGSANLEKVFLNNLK